MGKRNPECAAIAGVLLTVNFVLSGCFSAMHDMGRAWSGSQGPDAKRDALIADAVTMPVQAPLIAGITLVALPELLKGDGSERPIAGVTVVRLRAVDDEGMPLAGVRARVGYDNINRGRHPDGLPEGPSNNAGFFPGRLKPQSWPMPTSSQPRQDTILFMWRKAGGYSRQKRDRRVKSRSKSCSNESSTLFRCMRNASR